MKYNDSDMLSLCGYIRISKNRQIIFNEIAKKPQMPSELAKQTKLERNYVSNLLKQLKDKEIIECVNPDQYKGRIYKITDKGGILKNYLNEFE